MPNTLPKIADILPWSVSPLSTTLNVLLAVTAEDVAQCHSARTTSITCTVLIFMELPHRNFIVSPSCLYAAAVTIRGMSPFVSALP